MYCFPLIKGIKGIQKKIKGVLLISMNNYAPLARKMQGIHGLFHAIVVAMRPCSKADKRIEIDINR